MGGFGPALPLLQSEQGVSATVAGLHGTALGLASIIAGYLNAPLVHRFGRYVSTWIGLVIFNIGALAFVLLPDATQTIPAILFAGIGLSTTINNSIMYLSHHYGDKAPRAISQANGVNSAFVLGGNFLIGMIAGTTISWRFGLLICIPFAIGLYFFLGRHHKPEHIPDVQGRQRGKLPGKYWWAWLGLIFTIASEFALAFWAAALLRERTEISPALATTLVLAFPLGMMLGRWFGTYIFPHLDIDQRLQAILILQLVGFAIFWLSPYLLLSFLALTIVGLGTSMQFALTTLRLIHFGGEKPDLAMGQSSLGVGIAIGGSPLLLGFLADNFGISRGFLMVPITIAIAFIVVLLFPIEKAKS